jgi:predicted enzyme related to lactoylglutathione lyase
MEYWMIRTVPVNNEGRLLRSGVNSGFVEKENAGQKPANYISVESIDESIEKVKRLDGKIVMPKQEVSNVGWQQPWIQRKTKLLRYSRCICNSSLFLLI